MPPTMNASDSGLRDARLCLSGGRLCLSGLPRPHLEGQVLHVFQWFRMTFIMKKNMLVVLFVSSILEP